MILSGYNPGALAKVLQTAQQEFHEGGLIAYRSRPYLNYTRLDFLEGGQVRKGELIVNANWNAIKKALSFSKPAYERPVVKENPFKKIKQEMVPSDTVKQPKDTDPTKTKAQLEADKEGGSMVPLFVGACAVLAFIAFR